jgi:hypothetical protein
VWLGVLHLLLAFATTGSEVKTLGLLENIETSCLSALEKAPEDTGCRVRVLTTTDFMNLENILNFSSEVSVHYLPGYRVIVFLGFSF